MPLDRTPLSPAEWRIFKIVLLSPRQGASVEWVRSRLPETRSPSTVATLITRIRDKGWIRSEDAGASQALYYFPLIPSNEAVVELVQHLLTEYDLTPDELGRALESLHHV